MQYIELPDHQYVDSTCEMIGSNTELASCKQPNELIVSIQETAQSLQPYIDQYRERFERNDMRGIRSMSLWQKLITTPSYPKGWVRIPLPRKKEGDFRPRWSDPEVNEKVGWFIDENQIARVEYKANSAPEKFFFMASCLTEEDSVIKDAKNTLEQLMDG